MFDIGLWELIVIGILGLIVLGPERLPTAVRTVSGWIKTTRRMAQNVKNELEQELEIEKLHSDLKKAESISSDLNSEAIPEELRKSVQTLQQAAQEVTRPYETKPSNSTPPAKE
ncbi:Sec-independent protein translocase protein TatB [Psychrobium sp. 1_MG-2023]|uniref:Sec-independent protein translocase protein TatB n=1 Tax=Psychrobium sp. 1_MG-2023 TaxID=3062624 RepID=UPI000C34CCF2|nr:Sec-independent protein translocase protein TatB [Psychrobium sp. 1_MG-2023]MDP2561996.1 Sec-independent protein translocase protein TatB [Psychrobium sp. 1_MG-2023]PKF58622.1 twin-arginine translocase subunit TatB [Alteromonadales bacterium alter-6D02]